MHNNSMRPDVRKRDGTLGMTEEGFWRRYNAFFDEGTLKRKLTCISRRQIPEDVSTDEHFKGLYSGTCYSLSF